MDILGALVLNAIKIILLITIYGKFWILWDMYIIIFYIMIHANITFYAIFSNIFCTYGFLIKL